MSTLKTKPNKPNKVKKPSLKQQLKQAKEDLYYARDESNRCLREIAALCVTNASLRNLVADERKETKDKIEKLQIEHSAIEAKSQKDLDVALEICDGIAETLRDSLSVYKDITEIRDHYRLVWVCKQTVAAWLSVLENYDRCKRHSK